MRATRQNVRPVRTRLPPLRQAAVVAERAALPLHAMIVNVGHEHRKPPGVYDWDGRARGPAEWVLIQHTLAGRGELVYEGRRHAVGPGGMMLLTLPHEHRYWREGRRSWRFLYVCLTGSEAVRAARHTLATRGPVLDEGDAGPLPTLLIDAVRDGLAGRLGDPHENSARAYALSMAVLGLGHAAAPPPAAAPHAAAVAAAVDLARRRFAEPIGVDDLAHAAALSRFHFTRVFQQHQGVPPGEFLRRERLRAATALLQTTDLPLKAVAAQTGFPNPDYLARCFRKAHGLSPLAFRHASTR